MIEREPALEKTSAAGCPGSSQPPKTWQRLPLLLKLFLLGCGAHLLLLLVWQCLPDTDRSLFRFVANGVWSMQLDQKHVLSMRTPYFSMKVSLVWLALLQVEALVFCTWWMWVRRGSPDFASIQKWLLRVSAVCYLLFLATPFVKDHGEDFAGIALTVFWIPALKNKGGRLSSEFLCLFWLGPTILAPFVYYICRGLKWRLRRWFGKALTCWLVLNCIAVLVIVWMMHRRWSLSYSVVFLGTANLAAALSLWTGILELKVADRNWKAQFTESESTLSN